MYVGCLGLGFGVYLLGCIGFRLEGWGSTFRVWGFGLGFRVVGRGCGDTVELCRRFLGMFKVVGSGAGFVGC